MKEIKGNIWDFHSQGHWIVITTNGIVKSNGEAVMGKGIALEAKKRFPELPRELGRKLRCFGIVPIAFHKLRILAFPTKIDYRNNSSLDLIEQMCIQTRDNFSLLETSIIYMPRPGCGNGNLDWKDVKPVLEKYLDDRFVVVWKI